ncbi:MAG: hypothetical protein ACYST6_10210, partial [Planctomycetota bacterium]
MPPTMRLRNPARFEGAQSRRMRVQGGIPEAPMAPAAPVAATPVSPYAAVAESGATNMAQYNASVMRRTAGGQTDPGPSPLAGVAAQQHPAGGPGSVVNPFNPEGAPITREQYDNMVGQFAMTHRAAPAARGKSYSERYVGAAAGADGFEPQPMRGLLRRNVKAADDIINQYPQSVEPEVLANYKEVGNDIRRQYTEFRTKNTGTMSLDDLMELGDDLSAQYPSHQGFIRNLLQEQIARDPELNAEFQQFKLTGDVAGQGNELFRTQFDPAMQKQIMAQVGLATAPGGGFIMPQLAETLGLQEDELRGDGYKVMTAAGESVPATAETIADLANRLYGIGGAQPTQPAAAAAPDVTVEPGGITDPTVGPGGIVGQPGISGMLTTPDGRTVVQLEGGGQLDQEQAAAGIEALRARGNPQDLELANSLEGAFNQPERPMREGEVRVERDVGPVSTAAQINELGG